jgi:hypothetical protein
LGDKISSIRKRQTLSQRLARKLVWKQIYVSPTTCRTNS